MDPFPLWYVSVPELADHLKVTPHTLRRWIAQGKIPLPTRRGRADYWTRDEVVKFLARAGKDIHPEAPESR
jgi:predicted site-specific integrase-resolvase